jgi:hypothetical protein
LVRLTPVSRVRRRIIWVLDERFDVFLPNNTVSGSLTFTDHVSERP